METLFTERLRLDRSAIEDAPDIQKYFADWEIIQWMMPPVPWPYPESGAEDFLKNSVPKIGPNYYAFSIREKDRSEVIGAITYVIEKMDDERSARRGLWLARSHWCRGYMYEASLTSDKAVFEAAKVDVIVAHHAVENVRSRHLKQKQGYEYVRTQPSPHAFYCGSEQEEIWALAREKYTGR